MTIEDDIIAPVLTAILAITIAIGHQTLTTKASVEPLQLELDQSYITESAALREVDALTKELQSYRVTVSDIERAGASHTQAVDALKASLEYDVDPLILAALCKTESDFSQNCTHALPYVIGAFGISTKDHKDLPANPYSFAGNAKCSAYILRQNLDRYKGNYKKALTAYKGISPLGRKRADEVLLLRNKI